MIQHLLGDCRDVLKTLKVNSIHCCVTSPPYWGLRDYGVDGQIGLEKTPQEYVKNIVEVFHAVRHVLRDDGTLWLNLGDTYAGSGMGAANYPYSTSEKQKSNLGSTTVKGRAGMIPRGLKAKDLVGIPWRVAFALQEDGWYIRSDIIWHKPNPMPESVTDRPTKSHEYIFLLSKNEKYYYNADAIRETHKYLEIERRRSNFTENVTYNEKAPDQMGKSRIGRSRSQDFHPNGRNKRDVWTVPTSSYTGAHFAVYPPDLIRPCILAGCPSGGTILDPFGGSGTTAMVAEQEGRNAILIELNTEYISLQKKRTSQTSIYSNSHY